MASVHRGRYGRTPRSPARGRPEKPLAVTGDRLADNVGVATAWLLRGSRHAAGEGNLTAFGAKAAGPGGDPWPKWTVSRLENGATRPTRDVVAAYERTTGAGTGTLVAPLDVVTRYFAPAVTAAPGLTRTYETLDPALHRRLATLVDKVHADAEVTGAEWDELTAFLATHPRLWLLRPDSWERLAERLLNEMIIADGRCWQQRFEALARLLAHPLGEQAAIAACASLAADRRNQVFVETVCAVDNSTHHDAGALLLRQLLDPTTDAAFEGALLGCVRVSRHDLFDERQAAAVAQILLDRLAGGGLRDDHALTARTVLASLGGFQRESDAVANERLRRELHPRERVGRYVAGEVVRRLTAAVDAALPDFRVADDRVFELLLGELLFSPTFDVRLYTAMLVRAGPYGPPLADALVAELARPWTATDSSLVLLLLDALRVLGDDDQASALQAAVRDPAASEEVRRRASRWVGHMCTDDPDDPFWTDVFARYARRWADRHDEGTEAVLTGLTYGLGIVGGEHLLRRHADRTDLPRGTRAASRWWLDIPTVVRRSARR